MSTPTAVGADAAGQATPHPAPDPLRAAELDALWNAIAELPRAQRDALLLREIRGLSYGQLARDLSLSGPAIRSLLERARRRVRLRLRDVHTAASGISWLETAARLFAGGSSPTAPVARVAALGLGAAAITGGAIVTPTALEHHVRPPIIRKAPAHEHKAPGSRQVKRTAVMPVAVRATRKTLVADRHVAHETTARHAPSRRDGRREHHAAVSVSSRDGVSSGDGGSDTPGGDSHGGDTAVATSGPGITTVSPVIVAPTVTIDGGGDSHGSDGSSGSGGLDGSDGSDGSSSDGH